MMYEKAKRKIPLVEKSKNIVKGVLYPPGW